MEKLPASEQQESGFKSTIKENKQPRKKKTTKNLESPETWRDAWYHFFRVGAGIRRKEFNQNRQDFSNLGDAWYNLSQQVGFVSLILKILLPLFAIGELFEKFSSVLEIKLAKKKKKEESGDTNEYSVRD